MLVILVIFSLASALLYLNIYEPLNTHYSAILSIVADLKETLLFTTLKISMLSSFLAAIGILCLGILYTHRIAGPLYRIKDAVKEIGKGNFETKLRLRSTDAIHHFAESINSMTERFSERIVALSESLDQLKGTVAEVKSPFGDGRDTESVLQEIREKNAEIRSRIDSITL